MRTTNEIREELKKAAEHEKKVMEAYQACGYELRQAKKHVEQLRIELIDSFNATEGKGNAK